MKRPFAILTVFIAGLMVGRTPEFLGKKIEPYEMKWSVLVCLATPIIIALIPLALKGVKYREVSAGKLLSRNLLIYGLGGLVAPFIFVKLIDVLLVMTGLV